MNAAKALPQTHLQQLRHAEIWTPKNIRLSTLYVVHLLKCNRFVVVSKDKELQKCGAAVALGGKGEEKRSGHSLHGTLQPVYKSYSASLD